jgi:hypothetical protein
VTTPQTQHKKRQAYEPPTIVDLGTLHEVTLSCMNKESGGTDGITFQQSPIGHWSC